MPIIPEDERALIGMVYGIAAASSIFVNLLLLLIFCKEHRYYKKFPFYTFARHLIYFDCLYCLLQLLITVPSTIYSYNIYIEFEWPFSVSWWLTNAEELPHKGVTVFLLIASVHRLFLFVYPQMEAYCFREYASIIWRLLGWSYVLANTLLGGLFDCSRVFSYEYYYFYWICTPNPISQVYPMIIQMESYISLVVVLFVVLVIYVYSKLLRKSVQYNKKSRHEKDVLFQVFFISAVFLVFKISSAIVDALVPMKKGPNKTQIFVESLLKIAMCNVHPLSHMLFNHKVRNHGRRYICTTNRGSGKFQRPSRYNSPVPPPVNYVSYEELCQTPPLKSPAMSRVMRNRQQAKLIATRSV